MEGEVREVVRWSSYHLPTEIHLGKSELRVYREAAVASEGRRLTDEGRPRGEGEEGESKEEWGIGRVRVVGAGRGERESNGYIEKENER